MRIVYLSTNICFDKDTVCLNVFGFSETFLKEKKVHVDVQMYVYRIMQILQRRVRILRTFYKNRK